MSEKLLYEFKNYDWITESTSVRLANMINSETDIGVLKMCLNEVHSDFGMIRDIIKRRIEILKAIQNEL